MSDDKTKIFSAMRARTQENIARQKAAEYTPTTEEILRGFTAPAYKVEPQQEGEDFAAWMGRCSIETMHSQMASEAAARRWLAAHDAEVRADAKAQLIEQLRWLAKARAEYDHIPEGGYHSATETERLVYHEHKAAAGVADILEGANAGMGWLPSWKWDEWAAICAQLNEGNNDE